MRFRAAGIHNGQFDLSGNNIEFLASQTFQGGSSISGPGNAKFLGGTISMGATFDPDIVATIGCDLTWQQANQSLSNLILANNCKLRGSTSFTISSSLLVENAEVYGSGNIIVLAGASFNMVGPGHCIFAENRVLNNHTILNWTGGNFQMLNNFVFNNFGIFNFVCS